jgi:hypothetical protein
VNKNKGLARIAPQICPRFADCLSFQCTGGKSCVLPRNLPTAEKLGAAIDDLV